MQYKFKKRPGFSLIELIIVFAIGAILMGSGAAAYRQFARKQTVEAVMRKFRTDLRTAQTNARIGQKENCACGDGGDGVCGNANDVGISGWEVNFPNISNYEIYGVCSNGTTTFSSNGVGTKVSVPLSSGVTFNPLPSGPIRFKVLGQGTNLSSDIAVTLTGAGNVTTSLFINVSGDINNIPLLTPTPTLLPTATPTPPF